MICFNVGQKHQYSFDSIKTILNKSDFRELFSKVKNDLFNDYKSTDEEDLRQYLSELMENFNVQFGKKFNREFKKDKTLIETDVYPFDRIKANDIIEYIDSLKQVPSDPPLQEPVDGNNVDFPTTEHLDEIDLAQRDGEFSNLYTRVNDVLYPATIGKGTNVRVALVKKVTLKNGATGYMVAAVLSENEVKQYGIVINPTKNSFSGSVNKLFTNAPVKQYTDYPKSISVSSADINVDENKPFTVTKAFRNRVQYHPESTFGTSAGMTLEDYNNFRDQVLNDFKLAFPGLDIVSSFIQITTGKKNELDSFGLETLGKPVLKIIAKDSNGNIVTKLVGAEMKPRPVGINDSLVQLSRIFKMSLDRLDQLGISNNMILSYANILSSFWTIKDGGISKSAEQYPKELIQKLTDINPKVPITDEVLFLLDGIIGSYYGPVNGLFIAKNLNDFYTSYSPSNTLVKEKSTIKNMFNKFNGFQLDDKVVDQIFEQQDIRSGNILLTLLQPVLGHNLKNTPTNKEPKLDTPITINGVTTTYGEVRDLYRAARNKVVVIDQGPGNTKYVFQYEGQKIEVPNKKGGKNSTVKIFPNMNSVGRVTGNITDLNTLDKDENGKPILETKPRLRAGGGPLVREIARLTDTTDKLNLPNRNSIPELADLFLNQEDGSVTRLKPFLPNIESLTKTYLSNQAYKLRTRINAVVGSITLDKESFDKLFVTNKYGNIKLSRSIDLVDREVRDNLLTILENALPADIYDSISSFIKQDDALIQSELNAPLAINDVLSKISDPNNYDETGHWKISPEKKGEYLRRNLAIEDRASSYQVNENGRVEYKDDPNGFRLLNIAYTYLTDGSFKSFYDVATKSELNNLKLPELADLNKYITTHTSKGIKDAFENNILSQVTTNYMGAQAGSLAIKQGKTESAPTTQQAAQQTPAGNKKGSNKKNPFTNNNNEVSFSSEIENDSQIELDAARAYFKKQFPFASDKVLNFISKQAFNERFNTTGKAGAYTKGLIYIVSDGKAGMQVLRHEIFHKIFNEYLTEDERFDLYNAFKNKYFPNSTVVDMKEFEEMLAIKYQDYERTGNETGIIKRIFNMILRLFNFIRVNTNSVEGFFEQIEAGKFAVIKTDVQEGVRYMSDPINKMGGIENYDRAIKQIKKDFYKLLVIGNNDGAFKNGIKYYSTIDVKNRILRNLDSKINSSKSESNIAFYQTMKDNLTDLIENAFSFVDSLDVKEQREDDSAKNDEVANLKDHIDDKENQDELKNAPERVRFWLSNIERPTNEKSKGTGNDFIPMKTAFAKLVEITSKLDFNGKIPFEEQLDYVVQNLHNDKDYNALRDALKDLIQTTRLEGIKNKNILFLNPLNAITIDASLNVDLNKIGLYDPVQLKITKLDDGSNVFTYDYYEGSEKKTLTGVYYKKGNLQPLEFLNSIGSNIWEITPEENQDFLLDDIGDLYNASVAQSVLKDITKVISSNRERNIITLVKNSYKLFGAVDVDFDMKAANNKEYTSMQEIKARFIKTLDNPALREAFFTGKPYLKNVITSEEEFDEEQNPSKILPSIHLENILEGNDLRKVQKSHEKILESIKKVSGFLELGLKTSGLNTQDINDICIALTDILRLRAWRSSKSDVLYKAIDGTIEVPVYANTNNDLDAKDSSDEEDLDDDEKNILYTEEQRIGAINYLSGFNNSFFKLGSISLKGSTVEPSLSQRSRDGKNTNYRFIRKSFIFDVLNKLIFNNSKTSPIKIDDLNDSYEFLKSSWARLNPFLNGTSTIYQTLLQEGTASNNHANVEYFKKHSSESPVELNEKDLLYFAYFAKTKSGGAKYLQTLAQQGDSTAHNVVEVDMGGTSDIKRKVEAIIKQFVLRPTQEDLKNELGYEVKGYNPNRLVDFNSLAKAIKNAKINGVSVTEAKKNGKFLNAYDITGLKEAYEKNPEEVIEEIYKELEKVAESESQELLQSLISNPRFKLPRKFFSGMLLDDNLISTLSSFTPSLKFKAEIKRAHEETQSKIGSNHVRYKNAKSLDQYVANKNFQNVLKVILKAQVMNHGVNIFLIDQLVKGPSEFFGSPDASLKRRDSAGSPKEHLSVQTFDKNGNIVPGTERFARPKYKSVVVNDLDIVFDNREMFKSIIDAFKLKYDIAEGTDIESIASNLLYNIEGREQIGKDLLNKDEITSEEMNDLIDLAYSFLNNTLSSRQLLRSLNLSEEDLAELDKEYAGTYNPTDGQGFHTTLRNAEIKANAGSNAETGDILKPLHYETVGRFGVPTMVKYSSIHLSDTFVADKPIMKKVKEVLEKRGIDELVFASTVKVGQPATLISMQELLDDTNDDKINASTLTLSNNSYGLQLNPESTATKVSMFSQLLYFPRVTITDTTKVDRIFKALAESMASNNKAFNLDLYSNGMVSNRVYQNVLGTALNPKSSNNSDVVYDIFNALRKAGINAYNHPGLMLTTERAFLGEAHDRTIKTKFAGKKAVLVSSIATNNFGLKGFTQQEEEQINKLNLRTYKKDINGKSVLTSECILPRGKYDADGKWTGILTEEQQNLIDEAIKNNQPLPEFFLSNYSKNNFFGLRIPTTGIHSAIPLMVKGFYDAESDVNGVIVPPDIVQRHGSDFDVDSLFIVSRATFGKDYEFNVKSDDINDAFVDAIKSLKFTNKEDRKKLKTLIKEVEEIKKKVLEERRNATTEEEAGFRDTFNNSEWDQNLRDKKGVNYNEELSLAGFMTRYYPKFRYVISSDEYDGHFVYIGELTAYKKQLIQKLKTLLGETIENKDLLEQLTNELAKNAVTKVVFNANDYVGYTRVGNGFKFDDHIDPSNPSNITSKFLTDLDAMLPFVSVKDRKKLLEIRSKYFQNVMVEEFLNIAEDEDNTHMMVTTIYMDKYKNWISDVMGNTPVPDISTPISSNQQRSIATAGRIGTGISAIGIKMLSYLSGYTVKDDAIIKISRNGDIHLLDRIFNRSANENRDTLKELDALVNLNIDNIKELGLYPLNLNENTEGLYIAMRMLGLSFEEANSIMVQPIVKYIAQQPGYTPANIADLVRELKGSSKNFEFPILKIESVLNSKPSTIVAKDALLKDPTQQAVLGIINSALALNSDIRNINKIVDTIRARRNTVAEIKEVEGLVNKLKMNGFIVNIEDFLNNNPHIQESINISLKNLKTLEQKSVNHSVKIDEILKAATNVSLIKKDKDKVRDMELKRREIIKFFVSGFMESRSYPPMKIGVSTVSSNDAFMMLMYDRHLALQKWARNFKDQDGNKPFADNDFIFNVVAKPTSTPVIEVEANSLKNDSAAEYKMKLAFQELNKIKEVFKFKSPTGEIFEYEGFDPLKELPYEVTEDGKIIPYTYVGSTFTYAPEETETLTQLQKDYFNYEGLKSGLEFNNKSMASSFMDEQHIEFAKLYDEMMTIFAEEADPSVSNEITKLFDAEFTMNNRNGAKIGPSDNPVLSKKYATGNGSNMLYSYSGFDPAVGYYDLKVKAEKFDIAAFSNKSLPRVVVYNNKVYAYTGTKSDEDGAFNFYSEMGYDRKYSVYNFRSEMLANLNFIKLKQAFFQQNKPQIKNNVAIVGEEITRLASKFNIDTNVVGYDGKSINDLIAENNNASLFMASSRLTTAYYRQIFEGIQVDEEGNVDEGILNQMEIIASMLGVYPAIISSSTPIQLKNVVIDALNDMDVQKSVRSSTATDVSVPRLKVRSNSVTRTRIAFDYKMEYAFTNSSFDTFDSEGNPSKGILAVISEYNDVMNYESRLVKLVIKPGTLDETKYSAIVDVIEPSADELTMYYTPKFSDISRIGEDITPVIKIDLTSIDDPNNPLNCKRK